MEIFWKPEACGQIVLPERPLLIGQKLVENIKIGKFKWDILSNFQTLYSLHLSYSVNYIHQSRPFFHEIQTLLHVYLMSYKREFYWLLSPQKSGQMTGWTAT